LGECKDGQCTSSDLDKLARGSSRANSSLRKMSQQLNASSARRSAQSRLSSMQQTLAQCQSAVAGMCQSPFAGGQQAGLGSNDAQREGEERSDGQATELTAGAKASGPAMTTIEDADSGDGVSGKRDRNVRQEFARQLESFVERPDVP